MIKGYHQVEKGAVMVLMRPCILRIKVSSSAQIHLFYIYECLALLTGMFMCSGPYLLARCLA